MGPRLPELTTGASEPPMRLRVPAFTTGAR